MQLISVVIGIVWVVMVLVSIGPFLFQWLKARQANAPIPLPVMMAMRLRKVPVDLIVNAKIAAIKAGLSVDTNFLEAHYLAGGNVIDVIEALRMAKNAGLELNWTQACAIDLAGKQRGLSVLAVVKTSIETNQSVFDVFKFKQ